MEKYNFKIVENKWRSYWEKNKTFKTKIDHTKKNFIVWKCSHIHLEKFIWDMCEIIP